MTISLSKAKNEIKQTKTLRYVYRKEGNIVGHASNGSDTQRQATTLNGYKWLTFIMNPIPP